MTSFWDYICCRRRSKEDDFAQGEAFYEEYLRTRRKEDLQKALGLFESALAKHRKLPPKEKEEMSGHLGVILTTYSPALFTRYKEHGQSPSDLTRVIELDEEALELFEGLNDADEIAPGYEKLLLNLGDAYLCQYQNPSQGQPRSNVLFERAIGKYKALRLNPKASLELRRSCTIKMAEALNAWSEEEQWAPEARKLKVDEAIGILREAKAGLAGGNMSEESRTLLGGCLFNLAISYNIRYSIEKDFGSEVNGIFDLDKAIKYNRQAREMLLNGQGVELLYCLFDLTQQLFRKYEYFADTAQDQMQDGYEALHKSRQFVMEGLGIVEQLEEITEEINSIKEDLQKVLDAIEQILAAAP